MKKIFVLFFSLFLLAFVSLNFISCSKKTQAKDVSEYSEVVNNSFQTLTEKSGKLIDGFTYEIDDNARTITIKGNGILTNDYNCTFEWENYDYQLNYTLVLDNGITEVDCSSGILPDLVECVYLGKDIKKIDDLILYYSGKYKVDPDNRYFSEYNNSLYTKDFGKLLNYHCNNTPNDFHPNLNEIGDYAFKYYKFNGGNTIIIPWGVTKIGDTIFHESENGYCVIPDTAIELGRVTYEYLDRFKESLNTFVYWVPSKNNAVAWDKWHSDLVKEENWGPHPRTGESALGKEWLKKYEKAKITDIPADNIAKYYDIKPNSLKTFQNGKTYYFDSNYKMAKGWTKVRNTWYYFNDYGAAVVKIWLKSGGKWYYMQEDGTMATNKWIKWYNKWYYVGKDGAMYANRKTPDGYYVNSNGVWVQ